MSELTQERLKRLLRYDPETGEFSHRTSRGKMGRAVAKTGSVTRHGYIRIQLDGKRYGAHRLAFLYMTGAWPTDQVDHIDHVRSNNAWRNLRQVSHIENCQNLSMRRNNSSGHPGVRFRAHCLKWAARIKVCGKEVHLGHFDTLEAASDMYRTCCELLGFHANHGT